MSHAAPPGRPTAGRGREAASGLSELVAMLEPKGGRTPDAYDALTDLFLGDGPAPAPSPAAAPTLSEAASETPSAGGARTSVYVEGLILGHLPVLAAAWATQYARHVAAERRGPVALVRIRGDGASIDLIGGGTGLVTAATSLEDAVRIAAAEARAWLIRVDETSEPRLVDQWGLDAVTLLTAANEAAIVASYRTIKQLFKPGEDDESGPEVRLAIMGATAEQAAEASAKLERAARAFLRRDVGVTACISKIGPGRSQTLYRGGADGPADEVLMRVVPLIRSMPAIGDLQPSAPTPPPAPEPAIAVPPSVPAAPSEPEEFRQRDVQAAVPASVAGLAGTAPLALHLDGLKPLQSACPMAPGVELAADETGRLHLLARAAGGGVDEALSQLAAAAGWAGVHLPLLRLAARADGARLDGTGRPVLHLFSADARAVRRLGDADVRLHLLVRVEVGGQAGWYCTALN